MPTVYEALVQSKKIMDTLNLNNIVVAFDQAFYAKSTEILWKYSDAFKNIIPRMEGFHTVCALPAILGVRFKDTGLMDLCIESDFIAEGSVNVVLEGGKYNRATRFHKPLYRALLRLGWNE